MWDRSWFLIHSQVSIFSRKKILFLPGECSLNLCELTLPQVVSIDTGYRYKETLDIGLYTYMNLDSCSRHCNTQSNFLTFLKVKACV